MAGAGPDPDTPHPGPVPLDFFPSLGKLFNLRTELLPHCPLGFGPWWGKGLRLVPLPQCPQPH